MVKSIECATDIFAQSVCWEKLGMRNIHMIPKKNLKKLLMKRLRATKFALSRNRTKHQSLFLHPEYEEILSKSNTYLRTSDSYIYPNIPNKEKHERKMSISTHLQPSNH